ncbi:MAG: NAD-dependent epimerase/dehydratase family protein [Dysgonamonadaceae bacterium]|nr:NAD-dependent epimerase/dehydratase family protein [Dysgonamonadaceae bacterium]MDD3356476.1 NAD-dependent epimerase/dehydratase family protein [Dysgonamonadaceae bacterium]
MKIIVTGAAGFIGFHVVKKLLEQGYEVVGIDSINSYYDVNLKYARLSETGIMEEEIQDHCFVQSTIFPSYRFMKLDMTEKEHFFSLFEDEHFSHVVHLAAQAGVRYSLKNPYAYINSNIVGFMNLLEACRQFRVKHLVYASSSSVYGANTKLPYKESDRTDNPVSLYAATKKSNELMAYAYSKLYNIPATGIRFFTVYGPWGRPDMAPTLFMSAISAGQTIRVFNHSNMKRDFTYIDDIVTGLTKIIPSPPKVEIPHIIYNMGCSSPVKIMDFIATIEKVAAKKAVLKMVDMQPGDVVATYADTSLLEKDFGYKPSTPLNSGIRQFYEWFKEYYS